ncbi:hypothetical protein [Flavobacterium sp.]|uniref:hypothetical protein n=1 Tax=Flavobacterium sp. TaxID=239 RepID=UPI0039E3553E
MKTLKKIGALLLLSLSVSLVSCNSDDDDNKPIIPGPPTGTDIRYEVETSANIIKKIRYKKGNDQFAFGYSTPDSPNSWFMTIIVDFVDQPMTAEAEVTMKNDTGFEQSYTFQIFEDNEVVATVSGVLESSNAEIIKNITHEVDYNP